MTILLNYGFPFILFLLIGWTGSEAIYENIKLTPDISYTNITSLPQEWPLSSPIFEIGVMVPASSRVLSLNITQLENILALQCQVEAINRDPTILPNTFLKLVTANSSDSNSTQASIAAFELVNRTTERIAIIGSGESSSNPLISTNSKYFLSNQMALTSAALFSAFFRRRSDYPNLLVATPGNPFTVDVYFQLFNLFGWSLLASAFSDDDIGQSARFEFLRNDSADDSIQFACNVQVSLRQPVTFQQFLHCLKTNPDVKVVVYWGELNTGLELVRLMAADPDLQEISLVTDGFFCLQAPYNAADQASVDYMKGMISAFPYTKAYDGEDVYSCISQYKPKLGDGPFLLETWESTFSCKLPFTPEGETLPPCRPFLEREVASLIEIGGGARNCSCLLNETLETPQILSIRAPYYQDNIKLYALALDRILNNCTSIHSSTTDYCNLTTLTGLQLLQVMYNTTFTLNTGSVSFSDDNSTFRDSSYLRFLQFNGNATQLPDFGQVEVGYYDPSSQVKLQINKNLLVFKDGSDPPISIVVPSTTDLSSGTASVLIFSFSIVLLVILVVLSLTTMFMFTEPPFQSVNPAFIPSILLSSILLMIMNILWSVKMSQSICIWKALLFFFAIAFLLSALFTEAFVQFNVYNGQELDLKSYWICYTCCFAFVILFMFLYLFPAGVPQLIAAVSPNNSFFSYLSCATNPQSYTTVIISIFAGLLVALLLYSVIILILSWSLHTLYNDNAFILFTISNLIILTCILVPLYFTMPVYIGFNSRQYLLRSLGILFVVLVMQILLVMPKIYFVLFPQEAAHEFHHE